MLVLWGIFIVSLVLACIIGILLFVEIKSGHMPENAGLAIVVICYINIVFMTFKNMDYLN